jgi:lipopolysaccharide/colanic/teichoic acid biosynthesis glycosyltransferase
VLRKSACSRFAYIEIIRPTKVKLQLKYVRERSLLADLKIIFLTLLTVVCPGSGVVLSTRERLAMEG